MLYLSSTWKYLVLLKTAKLLGKAPIIIYSTDDGRLARKLDSFQYNFKLKIQHFTSGDLSNLQTYIRLISYEIL